MHIAGQGSGPLVLLCHGFPESWYSWRHQIPELARADFHAVAPDLRGYEGTDAPPEPDSYMIMHLVGDMVGMVAALGVKSTPPWWAMIGVRRSRGTPHCSDQTCFRQ